MKSLAHKDIFIIAVGFILLGLFIVFAAFMLPAAFGIEALFAIELIAGLIAIFMGLFGLAAPITFGAPLAQHTLKILEYFLAGHSLDYYFGKSKK